jgi:hypothetical protein
MSEKNTHEAKMWKHAHTQKELGDWIFKTQERKFGSDDEEKILKLADEIPRLVRRHLLGICNKLPRRGGRRRILEVWDAMLVGRRVEAVHFHAIHRNYAPAGNYSSAHGL